jgi:hypothetical protein
MWAEQQLAQAQLAVEAQTEIDREQFRRRVDAALEGHATEPGAEGRYLPIGTDADAASRAAAELPTEATGVAETENLPARVEQRDARATPVIPTIPDVTKAAARWIRPLVPAFVARAIDTTTQPLRTARQVFEDVEEITFSLKRTRRVTVETEESAGPTASPGSAAIESADEVSSRRLPAKDADDVSLPQSGRELSRELTERRGPREVRAGDGPRQLPPAE